MKRHELDYLQQLGPSAFAAPMALPVIAGNLALMDFEAPIWVGNLTGDEGSVRNSHTFVKGDVWEFRTDAGILCGVYRLAIRQE